MGVIAQARQSMFYSFASALAILAFACGEFEPSYDSTSSAATGSQIEEVYDQVPEFELITIMLDDVSSKTPKLFLREEHGKPHRKSGKKACSNFFACGRVFSNGDNDSGCTKAALVEKFHHLEKVPWNSDGSGCQPGEKMHGRTAAFREQVEAERRKINEGDSVLLSATEAASLKKNLLTTSTYHGTPKQIREAQERDSKEYESKCKDSETRSPELERHCKLYRKVAQAAKKRALRSQAITVAAAAHQRVMKLKQASQKKSRFEDDS